MTMETTPRFALPLLQPGQAQKEMSHNEALMMLDLLVHASVESAGETVPPTDPDPGQCWLVGSAPQGAWAGADNAIAAWTIGGWRFVPAQAGMRLWCRADGTIATFDGDIWQIGELPLKNC